MPDTEVDKPSPAPPTAPPRLPVIIWANDGSVCVSIIDEPVREHAAGVCRCGACHAAHQADWAAHFF